MIRVTKKKWISIGAIALAVTGVITLTSYVRNKKIEEEQALEAMIAANQKAALKPGPPEYMYGLRVDPFTVEEKIIGKGEFFADMLAPFQITFDQVFKLSQLSKPLFNVRSFVQGKPYRVVYKETASSNILKYLIYEIDAVNYVIYDFTREEPAIITGQKEMKVVRREATGVVNSSLFGSMTENNLSAQTAVELAEIFATSIDFYRVHSGDFYKIIFEEKIVDGEAVGIEKIIAAQFNHEGKDYFAFRFDSKGKAQYFDEKGLSQQKSFLKSPLKFGRLTSGYTLKRFHPVQKRFKAHLGTDYAAPKGTPILAVGPGVISEARYTSFNGNYVKIKHNDKIVTQYLHMSKFAKGIRPGAKVDQGQVIGYVGSTGLSTGPHVCFRYWKNGKQVNHLREKYVNYSPISAAEKARFMLLKDSLMNELEGLPIEEPAEEAS